MDNVQNTFFPIRWVHPWQELVTQLILFYNFYNIIRTGTETRKIIDIYYYKSPRTLFGWNNYFLPLVLQRSQLVEGAGYDYFSPSYLDVVVARVL